MSGVGGEICIGRAASLPIASRLRPVRGPHPAPLHPRPAALALALSNHDTPISMRILSFNANGIRSAANKGFFDWPRRRRPTCSACRKPRRRNTSSPAEFRPDGLPALLPRRDHEEGLQRRGDLQPARAGRGAHFARLAAVRRRGPLHRGALRQPQRGFVLHSSGSSGELRQGFKFQSWTGSADPGRLARSGRDYVLCGDWNIVRCGLDIRNWTSNQKNSGCLPRERDWVNAMCSRRRRCGWVDAYRAAIPKARTTPGGATAAPPVKTTWAGASTTSSSTPSLRDAPEGLLDPPRNPASPTTPPSSSTTRWGPGPGETSRSGLAARPEQPAPAQGAGDAAAGLLLGMPFHLVGNTLGFWLREGGMSFPPSASCRGWAWPIR